jgi:outer membrane protein assembly factor BamD
LLAPASLRAAARRLRRSQRQGRDPRLEPAEAVHRSDRRDARRQLRDRDQATTRSSSRAIPSASTRTSRGSTSPTPTTATQEPESALAAADRFIKLHPTHPATAYAYYLRGLVNFNRSLGFLDRFLPTDTAQRDPGAALESYNDFAEVVRKFPDSEYTVDSAQRMLYLRNNLARYEIRVARYYMRRGAYIAAANRAEYVVQNYQRTPAVREALEIMIDAYTRLGLPELATNTQRVLALNEDSGALIPDPQKLAEKSLGQKVWEFFELDQN